MTAIQKTGDLASANANYFASFGTDWQRWADRQSERLLSLPSELVLRLMNLSFVDRNWTSDVERQMHTLHSWQESTLDKTGAAILHALRKDGVCVTSLDALGITSSETMFQQALGLSAALQQRSHLPETQHRDVICANAADILASPQLLHWGLDTTLLNIVEAYLGKPAAYDGLSMYHSKPTGRESGTRIWHRDREDRQTVKIIIYASDVCEEAGPFQIIRPEFKSAIDANMSWRYATLKQAQLLAAMGRDNFERAVRSFTGTRGLVLLVDPARTYHRGMPPKKYPRSAIFHSYFPRLPRHPFCCERSPLSRAEIEEFAARLPPRQKDAMLWFQNLPLTSRLIPQSRLSV